MNQHPGHSYTAEEIRRYLSGEMSEAEMHALEKAALEDPMLADAIEGFQASIADRGAINTMQDVEALNRAFTERYHRTPVKHFPLWQVAAAAIVIVIVGVATFNYFNKPTEQLANTQTDTTTQAKSQKENVYQLPDTTVAAGALATNPSTPVVVPRQGSGKAAASRNNKATTVETEDRATAEVTTITKERSDDEAVAIVRNQTDSMIFKDAKTAAPQANRGESVNVPAADKSNNALHVISGRVVNANMEPLANASLIPSDAALQNYNNSNNRLNTDRAGYFNMRSPDTSLVVKVSAAGYQEQLFRLRNDPARNQLVLKPEKIIITGYGTAKKSAIDATGVTTQNAIPQGGWDAFSAYIEKSKIYPADSNLAGEVIVLFQINKQGKPGNFKIVQSLAKSYDEEAIRLINDGPKWQVSKGKSASVRVTVRF